MDVCLVSLYEQQTHIHEPTVMTPQAPTKRMSRMPKAPARPGTEGSPRDLHAAIFTLSP